MKQGIPSEVQEASKGSKALGGKELKYSESERETPACVRTLTGLSFHGLRLCGLGRRGRESFSLLIVVGLRSHLDPGLPGLPRGPPALVTGSAPRSRPAWAELRRKGLPSRDFGGLRLWRRACQ